MYGVKRMLKETLTLEFKKIYLPLGTCSDQGVFVQICLMLIGIDYSANRLLVT